MAVFEFPKKLVGGTDIASELYPKLQLGPAPNLADGGT